MLAGIAVILGALVAGTNRLEEWKRLEDQRQVAYKESFARQVRPGEINPTAFADYFREYVPFLGPVLLGEDLTMTGDAGLMAQVRVVRGNDAASYRVRLQNTGTRPFDASFSTGGAWLDTSHGRFYPPEVRALPIGTPLPTAFDPGTEANLVLTFKIPAQAKPACLVLALRLGQYYPNAQWTTA